LKINKNKGFALIELLTALAITGIALGALFSIFYYGLRQVRSIYHFSLANTIAQTEIETVRSIPFSQLNNGKDVPFIGGAKGLEELKDAEGILSIEDYQGRVGEIKKVTVWVRWREVKGSKRKVTFTTLVANRDYSLPRETKGTVPDLRSDSS